MKTKSCTLFCPLNYNQDNTINLRVHASEKPSQDFIAVAPQLDDVYFIALKTR